MKNHDMLASARRTLIAYIFAVYPDAAAREQALRELAQTLARALLTQRCDPAPPLATSGDSSTETFIARPKARSAGVTKGSNSDQPNQTLVSPGYRARSIH
jgi:hypothetical protein